MYSRVKGLGEGGVAPPTSFLTVPLRVPGDAVVSPSQLKTWELCQRKWAYQYIEGLADPGSAAAEFGQRVHKLLEAWQEKALYPGGPSREEEVARKLLPYSPPPLTARSEGHFWFEASGIRYRGFKDLEYRDAGVLTVHDWKTTSDMKWALDEEMLRSDPQGLIYAADSLTRWKANRVALKWVYGTTGKKVRTRVVRQVLTYDEVAEGFDRVHVSAARLVFARRQNIAASELPPSPKACAAFGGCPYRNNPCTLTFRERLVAIMDPTQSLKQRVAQQGAQNGQQQPMQPKPIDPQYVQQTPAGSFVQMQDGNWMAVAQGQDQQWYPAPQFNPSAVNQPPAQQPPAAVQPPGQQQPAAQPAAQPELPHTNGQPPGGYAFQPAEVTPQKTEETADPPSKGRGRPKGSTNKSKTLSKDEQVWLTGVQGALANPNLQGGQLTTDYLIMSGDMVVSAYHKRFNGE